MNIDSSRVLCLGGTTGIGLDTAQLASSRGANVTVVSAINSAVKALGVELAMEQEYATGSVLLIDGGTLVM